MENRSLYCWAYFSFSLVWRNMQETPASMLATIDMSDLDNEWDDLVTQLQQYESHIEEQKSQLKGKVERNVEDLRTRSESFLARWRELKPKSDSTGDPELILNRIREFSNSLEVTFPSLFFPILLTKTFLVLTSFRSLI